MPRFSYSAIDLRGDANAGWLDAPSAEQAAVSLKARGLFPTDISPAASGVLHGHPKAPDRPEPRRTLRAEMRFPPLRPARPRELALLTRQLAVLVRASLPLVRALETLAKQERNVALRDVLRTLIDDIRAGDTLSEALARHPRLFDRLQINMVKAGEAGGALDTVLDRLARFQEKSLQLKGRVRAAMVYPLIVIAVAAVILAGLLVFVVPKFQQIFADLLKGAPLPPLTQAVLTVSAAVKTHWLVALAGVLAGWFAFTLIGRTAAGKRARDALVLQVPLFGGLALRALVARLCRTFGTLLASGVPILPALLMARDTCGNARVADALKLVHDRVKEGEPVARQLEAARIFPAMAVSLVEVGEQTGQLPEMLSKVADIYDDEVDNAVAGLSSLIEPLLIVFLALVVGTIVIALFLPIVRIVQLLT
jgi:type IV pilus assembly protein PilC